MIVKICPFSGLNCEFCPFSGMISEFCPLNGLISEFCPFSGLISELFPFSGLIVLGFPPISGLIIGLYPHQWFDYWDSPPLVVCLKGLYPDHYFDSFSVMLSPLKIAECLCCDVGPLPCLPAQLCLISLTNILSYKSHTYSYIHSCIHNIHHSYMLALLPYVLFQLCLIKVSSPMCLIQVCYQSSLFQVVGSTKQSFYQSLLNVPNDRSKGPLLKSILCRLYHFIGNKQIYFFALSLLPF